MTIIPQQTVREVQVVERDTFITMPADSAMMTALLECDSNYRVVIRELNAIQGTQINCQTHTTAQQNAKQPFVLNIIAKQQDTTLRFTLRDTNTHEQQTNIVRERYIPRYYQVIHCAFWIMLAARLLSIVIQTLLKTPVKHLLNTR
jgi:hypothetical protein